MPVTIQPIEHYTLAQVVAGKLAGMILAGTYQPEAQLPSERDLISQFEVSRATLREALTTLAKSNLIEARPGVGWFVCRIDETNLPGIRELASIGMNPAGADGWGGFRRETRGSQTVAGHTGKTAAYSQPENRSSGDL